jgi:bifunctional non-homologous end joining protein LigD
VEEVGETVVFNWKDWRDCIEKYELAKQNIKHPIEPMKATLVDKPFSDQDWLYEVKWDGYRAITEVRGKNIKLYSRSQQDFSHKYLPVMEALKQIQTPMVIDGEIVMLDESGKPDFNALQNYADNPSNAALAYYVFDLLWLDGYDLTHAPLHLRKKLLKTVLPPSDIIRYSDHIEEQGEKFYDLACRQGLEGVIAKKADSSYMPARRAKRPGALGKT